MCLTNDQSELKDKNGKFGVDLLLPQVGGSARKTNKDYTGGRLSELIDIGRGTPVDRADPCRLSRRRRRFSSAPSVSRRRRCDCCVGAMRLIATSGRRAPAQGEDPGHEHDRPPQARQGE